MATGRTVNKWTRAYVSGYDLSGFMREVGTLENSYAQIGGANLADSIKGYLPGQPTNSIGPISAMMDDTAASLHTLVAADTVRSVMIPIGIQAIPAVNCPVYAGDFLHIDQISDVDEETAVSAVFAPSNLATTLSYPNTWGKLVHAKGAETGANSAVATVDYGAQTTTGGYACFQIFTSSGGDGTCTVKVQDASTNSDGSFGDLITSGEVDARTTPVGSIVALAVTATVERYIRFQVALNGATSVTFAVSFHRAIR